MSKVQLLANVHSRTFMNWGFICTLWKSVIYYLMQDFTHRFLLWIIRCLKSMPPFLCAGCSLFLWFLSPSMLTSYTNTPHLSFATQLQNLLGKVVSVSSGHLLTTWVHFFFQEIVVGHQLYAITLIDSRNSVVSKTGRAPMLLLIWKKTRLNIISDNIIAFLPTNIHPESSSF